ncbi:MAG: hypothetical protein Kow00108_24210 [Calditrichia bacterium]
MVTKERFVRFLKFGIVGASGILVNNAVLYILVNKLAVPAFLSSPFAIIIAIFNNFSWNNVWTWNQNKDDRHYTYFQRVMRYYIAAALGGTINYLVLMILKYGYDVHLILANLIGIAIGMISNFLFGEFWVFRSKTQKEL